MRQLLRAVAVGMLLTLAVWPSQAEAKHLRKQLPLTGCRGYHTAKGTATYTSSLGEPDHPDGDKLVVEIENVPLPPGTELLVFVHDVEVGTLKLDRRRGGQLTIEPTFRRPAPSITDGSFVVVRLIDGTNVVW